MADRTKISAVLASDIDCIIETMKFTERFVEFDTFNIGLTTIIFDSSSRLYIFLEKYDLLKDHDFDCRLEPYYSLYQVRKLPNGWALYVITI